MPIAIYSLDLAEKHLFMDGKVQVIPVQNASLEEKWRYFVMTRSDGRRVYCTSYIYYVLGG
jgi:hypothetical protein